MDKIESLGIALVKVDMTGNEQIYKTDLGRADRGNIPVNLLYPADYPNRPAIMLEELIWPSQALEALDRITPASESADVDFSTPSAGRQRQLSRVP